MNNLELSIGWNCQSEYKKEHTKFDFCYMCPYEINAIDTLVCQLVNEITTI